MFLQDLHGGGAERVALSLANAMAGEHRIDLVLVRREGDYLGDVDPAIALTDLGGGSTMAAVPRLARWLRSEQPDVLMTHLTHVNIAAALANRLAGRRAAHVAVEHNQMNLNFARISRRSVRMAYRAVRWVYPSIDAVVSVSTGVEQSVRGFSGIGAGNLHVLANPVVTPQLKTRLADAPNHPWLSDTGAPVILGCGRLVEQKDFETLIQGFTALRATRPARLLILGEGERRGALEALAAASGHADDIALPGFDANPYAAMRAATLFVLSSRWEGLPTVLIEALAAGANIVSTDCPSGPDEVLEGGRHGRLVPVGDSAALAQAMAAALDAPLPKAQLAARAEYYSLERAVARYTALFETLRSHRAAD